MRKLVATLLITIVLLSSLTLVTLGAATAQTEEPPAKGTEPLPPTPGAEPNKLLRQVDRTLLPKIEPQLLKKLLGPDNSPVPFIVYLKATTDLSAAIASAAPALNAQGLPDPQARRIAVVNALQQTARQSQAGILQALANPPPGGLSEQSAAAEIHPLWIINAVAAKGSLDTVLALAARPEVEVIRLDKEIKLEKMEAQKNRRDSNGELPGPGLPTFRPFDLPAFQSSTPWGIAKIRADLVHQALQIDGAGVVVANIDSGVDWQHPALQASYRGYTGPGKLPRHDANWFDATGEGAVYPADSNGHGTHTMGTMVGGNGLGVAPGARWIAARAFDSNGTGQNSWLHSAFQWILAPNNDPSLAPDIVNNSWGSADSSSTEFQNDIQSLLAAGIYPVFSAGNSGPRTGSIGSPGSLNIAFSVGATDSSDQVALFSSRGPSPWGKTKPEVAAPGKDVLSTLPGGTYGSFSGTSMAAPHVAGLAALLLQASPALRGDPAALAQIITSTAILLGSPTPNNDYGWGRVDAYNAVMAVAPAGILQGVVTQAGDSQTPVDNATIQIISHGGLAVNTVSDSNGAYLQGLAPGIYDVTAQAFGYEPVTVFGLEILTGVVKTQDFSLAPSPAGSLIGVVTDGNGQPLTATITIDGTPAGTETNPINGSYALKLPAGVYTVTATAAQHRVVHQAITMEAQAIVTLDFVLDSAPAILLVDSGSWYQESQIGYYQQALSDLLYPYDTWQISRPFATPSDVPTATTLANYQMVIWSAPFDSPGYIEADEALQDYLDGGGKLLLSGQDIAYFDGGGSFLTAPYLKNYLKARFVEDDSGIQTLTGSPEGPLAGLGLTIAGGDGANNQALPDVIANTDSDSADPLVSYTADGLAGLAIGTCLPYRAIFLSFGFESISSRSDRQAVLGRAIDWLMTPAAETAFTLEPQTETLIGNFGTVVSHALRLRNTGSNDDVYTMSLAGEKWMLTPDTLAPVPVPACQSQSITIGVRVDENADWHSSDTLTVTAQSTVNQALIKTVTRTTASPAPVLLVDDDRWYSFAAEYKEALVANNIPYDYWYVPKSWSGPTPPSPPLATLQMYPMVVWYTAFDWFQPLTPIEEDRLKSYLDGGGRLWFSSQDYIYNLPGHRPDSFAQNYLGVQSHTEDYSSTLIIGQAGNPVGSHLGPDPLTFPPGYKNWTDALTPTATAQVATRGQAGQPNGITHAGVGNNDNFWRTTFLAYGPELLAPSARTRLTQRALGWLSWLGSSRVTPNVSYVLNGSTITYTAVITNDGWRNLATAYFTATFPSELSLDSFSAELMPSNGDLIWQGPLARNESKVFTYTAALAASLPVGTLVSQTSWLAYPDHHLLFDRIADVYVNYPDLENSSMSVAPGQGLAEKDVLTYTIVLKNSGLVDDPLVTITNWLPPVLELAAIDLASQGDIVASGRTITWTTFLAKDDVATLTYRAVISYKSGSIIENTAYIEDDINEPITLQARAAFKIVSIYLPLIFKNAP